MIETASLARPQWCAHCSLYRQTGHRCPMVAVPLTVRVVDKRQAASLAPIR